MLTNHKFEKILKKYNSDLWLRVNNKLTDIQQLMYKDTPLGGCPRNYYPLEDEYERGSLRYRGLKNIALLLWNENLRSVSNSFEDLLKDFGIKGKDRAMVLAKATNDPEYYGFPKDEFIFYNRLDALGVWGDNRVKLLELLNKKGKTYDIEDWELQHYADMIVLG